MGLVRHVTTLELPNRVLPGLSHPFPSARKSLRLKILPINPMNAIFCRDFFSAAVCFQDFAGKVGGGGGRRSLRSPATATVDFDESPDGHTSLDNALVRNFRFGFQQLH